MADPDDRAWPHSAPGATDLLWIVGLTGLALAARLAWASGYGLNDDVLLRQDISSLLNGHVIAGGPNGYRFTWWIPTALSCRLFGLTEVGLILPVFVASGVGLMVGGVLGTLLFGRRGGILAVLLLAVMPLDFAWSTMLASDVLLSACLACMMVFVLQGLQRVYGVGALLCWLGAGVAFWLAVHAKLSAPVILPAVAIVLWQRRASLSLEALALPATMAALLLVTAVWNVVLWGNPLEPLHKELVAQGLSGPRAVAEHPLTAETFVIFPRMLFLPNHLGDLVFGIVPHLTVALVLVAPLLGLRTASLAVWWLVILFAGMEFNIQHAEGGWVAGFRNVRHAHPLVHPLVLTATGLLVSLQRRVPRVAMALVAVTLAVGAWQSISVATKMRDAFADRRSAIALLAALPPKPVYGDFQLGFTMLLAALGDPRWRVREVHPFDRDVQKRELDAVQDGYLVTGGGREPYYGCYECIPSATQVSRDRWRLLHELPGPRHPVPWRQEPLRVWEAVGGG